jgi:23S rRNA (guanine745-N1)-methyltransferase
MITALSGAVDLLRCPRCDTSFAVDGGVLRCHRRHEFDIARQGYVNLTGAAQPANADSPAMVAARAELLGSGRYAAITDALITALPSAVQTILDVGTGTGHYAAAVLDARPEARALGLDVSVAACRRAARAHPRLAVATADAWAALPVRDACTDVVLSVFSPRNAEEFARVLRPGGSVITVTPGPDHLAELRSTLGLLGVEDGKGRRLTDAFGRAGLVTAEERAIERTDAWSLDDAVRSIMMGPNAFHSRAEEARAEAERLSWPRSVTLSCLITRWTA